jgi:hypothetical protein
MGSQKISLKKENVDQDFNRLQWIEVSKYLKIDLAAYNN